MRDLNTCREAIDEIDGKIIALLSERRSVAEDIALNKLKEGKSVSDPQREMQKLAAVMDKARQAGLPGSFAAAVFRTVMAHTVSCEQRFIVEKLRGKDGGLRRGTSVAYLGGKGSYSHLAAMRWCDFCTGEIAERGCASFDEIDAAVTSGKTEYGVLPVENSSSGSINQVLDVLQGSKAVLVGEIFRPIDHSVLAVKPVALSEITDIYSHPQPVEQCSRYLKDFMPGVRVHYTKATSEAMEQVQKLGDPHCAAIASHHSGQYFGLVPVMDNISNNIHNYTRFVVISMTPVTIPETVPAKTSLSFTVAKYTPGSLISVLEEFSSRKLNLDKLTSRPRLASGHDTWEEIFFADVQGNLSSNAMQEALSKVREHTSSLKILGCYEADERHG